MSPIRRTVLTLSLAALGLGFGPIAPVSAQQPAPQAGRKAPPAKRGGFMPMKVDPRVQMRSYLFEETGEKMEYALFISSKVRKEEKAPLIVTLHGLGAGPAIMFGAKALELAEEGGYILVGPMGYNVRGWYGISMKGFGPKPKPAGSEGAAAKPKPSMFSNPDDPENLNELSEKDVMHVLDLVRGEFKVDERRIYLMGHSMGGAGDAPPRGEIPLDLGGAGPDRRRGVHHRPGQHEGDPRHAHPLRPRGRGRSSAGRQHAALGGQGPGTRVDA